MPGLSIRSLSTRRTGNATRLGQATGLHPAWLIGGSSVWMATLTNLPLWDELQRLSLVDGPQGWGLAVALGLIIAATLTLLLSLAAWRWTFKPLVAVLLMASALGAYFMMSYHIVIDSSMIVNAAQTDWRESSALFNLRLLATLLLLGALPAWWIWRQPVAYGAWPRRLRHNLGLALLASVALAAVVAASFQPLSTSMRNHRQLRYLLNPLSSLYAGASVATAPWRRKDSVLLPIGEDAHAGGGQGTSGKPPLLVLVVGETARSANFGLNGYPRPTTPELQQEQVLSVHKAWSCGTSTAASLPCMFSHLGREGFGERRNNYEGLPDLVWRAGMAVLWIDNQSGCKGVCARVPNVSTVEDKNPALCDAEACFDAIMLERLDERIQALPPERRAQGVLVVLHQMGSHGPAYYKRSPSSHKRFLPECQTNDLQRCSRDELVNAYDNSIAYTDHFLASTVRWLKARSERYHTAMVYVSDHGESLGEHNLYLHGLPWSLAPDTQKQVPWISWLSPGLQQRRALRHACLATLADKELSHDHLFHSVLGLLDVRTALYRRQLDAYQPCAAG